MPNIPSNFIDLKWYAKVNDEIGGWCIGTDEETPAHGGNVVADMLSEESAQHIVALHNASVKEELSIADRLRKRYLIMTQSRLEAAGACQDQIDTFVELFPDGVEITVELCDKHANEFSWSFAANNFLSDEEIAKWENSYMKTESMYRRHMDPVYEARNAGELTREECSEKHTIFIRAYNKANARAFSEGIIRDYENARARFPAPLEPDSQ